MLPIVDKPLIQYAVEEAAAAGITEMIFVTGRNKRAIEDHFDKALRARDRARAQGQDELLDMVRSVLPEGVRCIYIRQAEPLGLGHAVLCAQPVVGDEPFAVMLADDLIDARAAGDGAHGAGVRARGRVSVLGVEEVPRDQTQSYGIVTIDRDGRRPGARSAASSRSRSRRTRRPTSRWSAATCSRRASSSCSARSRPGAGGEIQLTDAISALLRARARAARCDCRASATTAARSSATCRRRSSSGCGIPRSARTSRDYLKSR